MNKNTGDQKAVFAGGVPNESFQKYTENLRNANAETLATYRHIARQYLYSKAKYLNRLQDKGIVAEQENSPFIKIEEYYIINGEIRKTEEREILIEKANGKLEEGMNEMRSAADFFINVGHAITGNFNNIIYNNKPDLARIILVEKTVQDILSECEKEFLLESRAQRKSVEQISR